MTFDVKKVPSHSLDEVRVFPNPAGDEAWIDLTAYEGLEVTLVLSDLTGKIMQQEVIQTASSAPHRLGLNNVPIGLYLIKVQAQGRRALTQKIQITK